jgi:hypothetical protein
VRWSTHCTTCFDPASVHLISDCMGELLHMAVCRRYGRTRLKLNWTGVWRLAFHLTPSSPDSSGPSAPSFNQPRSSTTHRREELQIMDCYGDLTKARPLLFLAPCADSERGFRESSATYTASNDFIPSGSPIQQNVSTTNYSRSLKSQWYYGTSLYHLINLIFRTGVHSRILNSL